MFSFSFAPSVAAVLQSASATVSSPVQPSWKQSDVTSRKGDLKLADRGEGLLVKK